MFFNVNLNKGFRIFLFFCRLNRFGVFSVFVFFDIVFFLLRIE